MLVITISNLVMINQPNLIKMYAESGKVAQKGNFVKKIDIFSEPIYSLNMRLLVENNLFLMSLFFTFHKPTGFTVTI